MKLALLNFELKQEAELQISLQNRAFQYNDGAFETMLYVQDEVRFLENHLNRLQRAAQVLQLELPEQLFDAATLSVWVKRLIRENRLAGKVRVKLKVWRSGSGLYAPEINQGEFLLTVRPHIESSAKLETAGFATSVRTHFSSYSFFKGPNSLQYVLAGLEKKSRNLDEIILLSSEGFVSECLASNIFWVKGETVFTPSIETGCVAGIMRENLLRFFQAENIAVQEGDFLPEYLLKADSIFTSNAAGIKLIRNIGEKTFKSKLPESILKAFSAQDLI